MKIHRRGLWPADVREGYYVLLCSGLLPSGVGRVLRAAFLSWGLLGAKIFADEVCYVTALLFCPVAVSEKLRFVIALQKYFVIALQKYFVIAL